MALDYTQEPPRQSSPLVVHTQTPYNAETPLPLLVQHFVTPVEHHYVRCHGPIPDLDAETHIVEINGMVRQSLKLTVPEMKRKYEKASAMVVMQCAGNRRDGLNEVHPTEGVIWGPGALGNALWTGIRLRDVLLESGVPDDSSHPSFGKLHVSFQSVAPCEEAPCYGSSIPLEKAMDPCGDVLLAFEMNGAPLTRDHGFPVRVIVPGYIGARSVKHLRRITVQSTESDSYFQQFDYKVLPPQINKDNLTPEIWSSCPAVQENIIQSFICEPTSSTIRSRGPGEYVVRGYAHSGDGRPVTRVEVSSDNCKTWIPTTLHGPETQTQEKTGSRPWSWYHWESRVYLDAGAILACRAWDASGNKQPKEPVWNYRGVMNNAWCMVRVEGKSNEDETGGGEN